jgi:hypothetical protein
LANRQTDTKIWTTQRWFKKLHPTHKLAWKYLTDACDHAGIWKIDFGQLVEDTGLEDFDLTIFINACNQDFDKENGKKISRERIKIVNKKTVWLTGFIRFQYENKDFMINPDVPAINSALTILKGYGILDEGLDKGYYTLTKPYTKRTVRTRDIDKDKDTIPEVKQGEGLGGAEEREAGRKGAAMTDQMLSVWTGTFPMYTADRERDTKPLSEIIGFIFKDAGVKMGYATHDDEIKALNTFQLIADQVNREPFWTNKPLSTISKHIQEFYNKLKNPQNGSANGQKHTGNGIDENKLKQKLAAKDPSRRQDGH